MARIAGVDLPNQKRIEAGLTYIFGIGFPKSNEILSKTGVNPDTRVKDLTDDEVKKLADYISEHVTVEGDLRREVNMNIKTKMEINSYQGTRHKKGLPVRGQRTNRNARTRKGRGKVVANKKK